MTEQSKSNHEVGFEKASITVGLALVIWSFFIAFSVVTNPTYDFFITSGLLLFFMPLIGVYLVINSTVNILRAIRDGE